MIIKNLRNKRAFRFFTAAVLAGMLMGSQISSALAIEADQVYTVEEKNILDYVVIPEAVALEEIRLPESIYGILSWVHPLYVPEKEKEECEVVLEPKKDVDVSWMKGWDAETKKVNAYITVYVGVGPEEEIFTEESSDLPEEMENIIEEEAVQAETEESSAPESTEAEEESIVPEESFEIVTEETLVEETEVQKEENSEVESEDEKEEAPAVSEEMTEEKENPEETVDSEEKTEDSNPDENQEEEKTETIFDRTEIEEDTRPEHADPVLTEAEKRAAGVENHICEGISVSGDHLPWYVQFRVSDGAEYQFSNQDGAELFKAYEFKLWDTMNDIEYVVPDGEYITIRMTVPEGYDYTVEHILASGAKESIYPMLSGSTLVFSTHSFSPFGIAGSTTIVGGNIVEENYQTPTPTPKPEPTRTPVKEPSVTPTRTPERKPTQAPEIEKGQGSEEKTEEEHRSEKTEKQEEISENPSGSAVPNTGDNSMIFLYAGIAGAAFLLIIIVAVALYRKKK